MYNYGKDKLVVQQHTFQFPNMKQLQINNNREGEGVVMCWEPQIRVGIRVTWWGVLHY